MARHKRRSFTPDFKGEAVRLVRESGRPLAQVARELLHRKLQREATGRVPATAPLRHAGRGPYPDRNMAGGVQHRAAPPRAGPTHSG
jgi:hypothetical protein